MRYDNPSSSPGLAVLPLRSHKKVDSGLINTITITANADHYWVIDRIDVSISGVPAAETTLTITFGGAIEWEHEITSGGFGPIPFHNCPIFAADRKKNEEMIVELSAPGGSLTGQITVHYR